MKNQLSENQLTETGNLLILANKANYIKGTDVSLRFKGKKNAYVLKITQQDKLVFKEKFYVEVHNACFDWIMRRWRKELSEIILKSKQTAETDQE